MERSVNEGEDAMKVLERKREGDLKLVVIGE